MRARGRALAMAWPSEAAAARRRFDGRSAVADGGAREVAPAKRLSAVGRVAVRAGNPTVHAAGRALLVTMVALGRWALALGGCAFALGGFALAFGGFAFLLGGCATSSSRAAVAEPEPIPSERVWEYDVRATAGARELRVEMELPAGVPDELGLDAFAHPFLHELELQSEEGWVPVPRVGRRWIVPRCRERGCRMRYVYRLGEAARRIDRFAYAGYRAGALLAPPSTFLLAPQDYEGSDLYRFRVELAPGESFVTGVWREAAPVAARGGRDGAAQSEALSTMSRHERASPAQPASVAEGGARSQLGMPAGRGRRARSSPGARGATGALAALQVESSERSDGWPRAPGADEPEVFSAPASVLFQAPYSAFGAFERERLDVGGASIELAIAPGARAGAGRPRAGLGVSRAGLRAALRGAAAAVSGYYGRFPVPEVAVIVLPSPGGDIFGMQLGNGGAAIVLFVGTEIDDERLARDWVITHELLHLGFPTLGRRHLWLAEGLATYQEPIARARAGLLDERGLWRALRDGMPKGLPNVTDGGLDGSMRWGRTYWGGAIFCLLLDVEVRARTDNRLSLDTAARAILLGGGDTSMRWSLEQTLAAGDAALDRPTLAPLYADHAAAPVHVDLDALFARLGVRRDGDRIELDDTAELAHVRRSIGRGSRDPDAPRAR